MRRGMIRRQYRDGLQGVVTERETKARGSRTGHRKTKHHPTEIRSRQLGPVSVMHPHLDTERNRLGTFSSMTINNTCTNWSLACSEYALALEQCRAQGFFNKFLGGCNEPKQALILCLRKEASSSLVLSQ